MIEYPFVSVIMPIRNEAHHIRQSLDAVLDQTYPRDSFEVIVADGMSTDGTREIIHHLQAEYSHLYLIDNPGQIVPTGFNKALQRAQGDLIIRVDGHTEIAPDYVCQCVAELQRTGADNAGGKMTAINKDAFGKAVALATSSPFGVGGARFHYSEQEEWVDTVYLGAWPRRVFEQIGLFDEEMVRNQDDEFNYRLRKAGGRILLSPKIKSKYIARSSPNSLWRQYFQYGYWKVRVLQKHPGQMQPRQFAPLTLVGLLSLSLLLAPVSTLAWWLFVCLAGAYMAANLAASTWTAGQTGWRHLLRLTFVFSILHLSYGFGFWVGLIKFWNRWGDDSNQLQSLENRSTLAINPE